MWGIRGKSLAHDPLHAEILALKMGLQSLRLKEEGRVIIETDSSNLANLIYDMLAEDHPWARLLKDCRSLLANIMLSTVCFVPRTCNSCAHLLAQSGYNQDRNACFWVDVIPNDVTNVLFNDMIM